jgi:CheY-like chemotaxis protein
MSTVLVVDDDPGFLQAVKHMLSAAGYDVIEAHTGKEAVNELEQRHGDIAVTIVDLALPDINGFELIGAITRRSSGIKILATTSVYKDTHLEMVGSVGAHAAIRKPPAGKPLPEQQWLATVRRLIDNDRGRSAAV